MKTIVSGIQPTGKIHIGNYFGAVKKHIELHQNSFCIYFIASYHALTTLNNKELLSQNIIDLAMDYIALGLDVNKSIIFNQSDVPEVAELAWILSTVTGMGLISRSHAYKDKTQKGISTSVGLFSYPVLMAADILAYNADVVPVGEDQIQHLQITRDIAKSFNQIYGKTFKLPKEELSEFVKVLGTDGQKMSKTYGNTIPVFLNPNDLKKRIDAIKTDSSPVGQKKNPDESILYSMYSLFANENENLEMRNMFESGAGYSEIKSILLNKILSYFSPAQEKRNSLKKQDIIEILIANGQKARKIALETLKKVKDSVGLNLK